MKTSTTTTFRVGQRIAGRYFIYQAVSGGMGEVYLCEDQKHGDPVALKTFQKRHLTSSNIHEYFKEEVDKWITLGQHPNIVTCQGFEILENQPFIRLDWIAADMKNRTDLSSWLRNGALDLHTSLIFAIDICRGLIHANKKVPNIVHRDLKPANILIDQGKVARITDFGLATIVANGELGDLDTELIMGSGQSIVGSGTIAGTPAYMAPEQWYNEDLDVRTDIYAIGCILYEMLAGERAFTATDFLDVSHVHIESSIPSLEEIPALPSILDDIVGRCLAKHREDRYQNAEQLLNDLVSVYRHQFGDDPRIISHDNNSEFLSLINQAITYAQILKYDKAINAFDHAISLEPDDPMVYVLRGATYLDMMQVDTALEDINTAIALGAEEEYYLPIRGLILGQLQRYDEAVVDLNRALKISPRDAIAYTALGGLFTMKMQFAKALPYLNRAIELDPDSPLSYINRCTIFIQQQELDKASADLRRVFTLLPYMPPMCGVVAYTNQGLLNLYQGNLDEAFLSYNRAFALNIEFPQTYVGRGMAYLALGQSDKAFADFNKAIELDPTSHAGYLGRAAGYMATGHPDKALDDMNYIITTLLPDIPEVYLERGKLYLNMGNPESAFADFDYILQLQPEAVEALILRGATYIDTLRPVEGMNDLNKAIAMNPQIPIAYVLRGAAYIQLFQPEQAMQNFQTALEITPDLPPNVDFLLHIFRGNAHMQQERLESALADFNEAIGIGDLGSPLLSPQSVALAYLGKGQIYFQLDLFDNAQADFERALEIAPHLPQVYFFLGLLNVGRENKQEAILHFEKALALGFPENPIITEIMNQAKGEQEIPFEPLLELVYMTETLDDLRRYIDEYPLLVNIQFLGMLRLMLDHAKDDPDLKDDPDFFDLEKKWQFLSSLAQEKQRLSTISPVHRTSEINEKNNDIASKVQEDTPLLDESDDWFDEFLNFFMVVESPAMLQSFVNLVGLKDDIKNLIELLESLESMFSPQLKPIFNQRLDWLREIDC